MSSPLDGRIRVIAEQVLAAASGAGAEQTGEVSVQQQISDLHEHLHEAMTKIGKLEYRIEFLEQGAQVLEPVTTGHVQEPAKPRRTGRKPAAE